jgi:excisionase family DNA binding protein
MLVTQGCAIAVRLSRRLHKAGDHVAMDTKKSPLGLSTSQAAHALGVSLGTIRRWSDMGYLESYRTPGGQRRFSHEQINQFVSSLQRSTDSAEQRIASVG